MNDFQFSKTVSGVSTIFLWKKPILQPSPRATHPGVGSENES